MNLPNKITMFRIILAFVILVILLMPWSQLSVSWPLFLIKDVMVDFKYILVGILFLIASITDFIDGYIARRYNQITDFGKIMDAIADKILVNGILIILAYERIIPVVIPVVIITRDIITDSCKSVSGSKGNVVGASILGKVKTIFIMTGLTLVLFYELPFILLNVKFGELLLLIGCVLSIVSSVEYVTNAVNALDKE